MLPVLKWIIITVDILVICATRLPLDHYFDYVITIYGGIHLLKNWGSLLHSRNCEWAENCCVTEKCFNLKQTPPFVILLCAIP